MVPVIAILGGIALCALLFGEDSKPAGKGAASHRPKRGTRKSRSTETKQPDAPANVAGSAPAVASEPAPAATPDPAPAVSGSVTGATGQN